MTVYLFRDEARPVFFRFYGTPQAPLSVQMDADGPWKPLTLDGQVGTALVCGPDVVNPSSGYSVITGDCVPRIRDAAGEMFMHGWIRLRERT